MLWRRHVHMAGISINLTDRRKKHAMAIETGTGNTSNVNNATVYKKPVCKAQWETSTILMILVIESGKEYATATDGYRIDPKGAKIREITILQFPNTTKIVLDLYATQHAILQLYSCQLFHPTHMVRRMFPFSTTRVTGFAYRSYYEHISTNWRRKLISLNPSFPVIHFKVSYNSHLWWKILVVSTKYCKSMNRVFLSHRISSTL